MLDNLDIKDKQNFISDPDYPKVIKKEEKLLWSGLSYKINVRGRKQNRQFLLTSDRIINMGKKNMWNKMKFWSKLVKREIKVEKVTAVTYSKLSSSFVLHVPSEYDYHLSCQDKDEFIEYMLAVLKEKGVENIDFYEVEEVDLAKYTKNEGQKKDKFPEQEPLKMNYELF